MRGDSVRQAFRQGGVVNDLDATSQAEIAEANQAYGALTEGLYITAFTFERAMAQTLKLLKGGGWRAAGPGFEDVNAFIRSLQLDGFKIVAEQRKDFVERVKALQPAVSNRAIAEAVGVGKDTINRDVGAFAPRDGRKAPETRKDGGAFAPMGAPDGRRDARLIVQRDTREERREENLRGIGEAAALSGLFPIIYADPAWDDDFGHSGRDTEIHYPTMTLDEIKALAVEGIAAPDSVLYLWALPHMFHKALEVAATWGFKYRTHIVWNKDKIGLGRWARQKHENLLICRKGAFPPPPEALRSASVIDAPVSAVHSEKPAIFAQMIEAAYPVHKQKSAPTNPSMDPVDGSFKMRCLTLLGGAAQCE